jgi:hypothetical protein
MDISGNTVLIHLSAQGRRSLGSLAPKEGPLQALVLATDSIGVWVAMDRPGGRLSGGIPVMLVKWKQISTVLFGLKTQAPRSRPVPGFIRG